MKCDKCGSDNVKFTSVFPKPKTECLDCHGLGKEYIFGKPYASSEPSQGEGVKGKLISGKQSYICLPEDLHKGYPGPVTLQHAEKLEEEGAWWCDSSNKWVATCRSCGSACEVWEPEEEFDADTHYCGGSPSCCP